MGIGPDDGSFGRDGGVDEPSDPELNDVPSGDGRPPPERAGSAAPSPGASEPTYPPYRDRPEPTGPEPRPRIVEDPGILGLSRIARSRIGSRLFTWFFVLVFALIVVQMIVAILDSEW